MNSQNLKQQFAKIGATLEVEFVPDHRRRRQLGRRVDPALINFWLDVRSMRSSEIFVLTIDEEARHQLDFLAVDVQPRQRHLLVLAKQVITLGQIHKEKFLCGHDERHWFVAEVAQTHVTRVSQALEALKPQMVIDSQRQQGVRPNAWHKRRNAGFIRQGEWFFVPRPEFQVTNPHLILHDEPIQRGRGKPHQVAELFRLGGETVYANFKYPDGLTGPEYETLLKLEPWTRKLHWQVMRRNPTVYARGKVRHPDHQTIILPFWHQVILNGEMMGQSVAFLD